MKAGQVLLQADNGTALSQCAANLPPNFPQALTLPCSRFQIGQNRAEEKNFSDSDEINTIEWNQSTFLRLPNRYLLQWSWLGPKLRQGRVETATEPGHEAALSAGFKT